MVIVLGWVVVHGGSKTLHALIGLGHVFICGVKQYIIRFMALLMNSHERIIIVYIF